MELIAKYIEIHRPLKPHEKVLKEFLEHDKRLRPYQRKVLEALNKQMTERDRERSRRLIQLSRGSGKSFDVLYSITELIARQYQERLVQEIERQLYGYVGLSRDEMEFHNGSSIDLVRASENVRGVMSNFGIHTGSILEPPNVNVGLISQDEFRRIMREPLPFPMEGDTDGDVPSVPAHPSFS